MKIPQNKTPILRIHPKAATPYMRYQIGFNHSRPFQLPNFLGRILLGYRASDQTVNTFFLCSASASLDKACAMAGIKTGDISIENTFTMEKHP